MIMFAIVWQQTTCLRQKKKKQWNVTEQTRLDQIRTDQNRLEHTRTDYNRLEQTITDKNRLAGNTRRQKEIDWTGLDNIRLEWMT